MADEITVVGVNGPDIQLLMLFPITTAIEDSTAAPAVPSPSSSLPAVASALLSQAEKDALDLGTSEFRVITITAPAGLSEAAILARAREVYTAQEAAQAAEYATKYEFMPRVGQRFNR